MGDIVDMAGNVQGFDQKPSAPEFSGMQVPQTKEPDQGPGPNGQRLIILEHRDFSKLDGLIREETEARERFETALKHRDKFCLELEQKHKIAGLSWVVDSKKGAIVVTGQRNKP